MRGAPKISGPLGGAMSLLRGGARCRPVQVRRAMCLGGQSLVVSDAVQTFVCSGEFESAHCLRPACDGRTCASIGEDELVSVSVGVAVHFG